MGRLIRVADIERLAAQGQQVVTVDDGTIVSPLARDRARELGVRLAPAGGRSAAAVVRRVLEETLARLGDGDLAQAVRQAAARVVDQQTATPPAPPPVGDILADRVALVTGASSGIGASVAVALANAGARVLVGTFKGDPHPAEVTAEAVRAVGGECEVVEADVTRTDELEAACDLAVRRWGRLDIAVANAAVLRRDPLSELTDQRWREVLDVDLGGVMRTARAAAARMSAGGAIVCVSSIAGAVFGWPEHVHYAAAKAGILGLTRSLAVELGPRGIRVNAVLPGLIETPQSLDEEASLGKAGLVDAASSVPLQRIGTPDEVAAVIRFLVSDQASYLTGQAIVVDGGISNALPVGS